MRVDQKLVDAAIELMKAKYPTGLGGASAMYTESGEILTSVGLENCDHESVNLCHETGAILEAVKFNKKIVAAVCVTRENQNAPIWILAPCGICQERLRTWGEEVEVAVPDPQDSAKWQSKTLRETQPYYWAKVFK